MKIRKVYLDEQKLATWHYVSSIQYLGPIRFRKLLAALGDNIEQIYEMEEAELLRLKGIITTQVLKGIKKQKGRKYLSEVFARDQITRAKEFGGSIVLLDDEAYPDFLRKSNFCHPILFYRGNLDAFTNYEKSLAILGTRIATRDSLKIARRVASNLAEDGWVIVSGMAKGIDACAHEGALEVSGKTIAVLGSGVDKPYPPECRNLYEQIAKENLIISEFPFGARTRSLQLKKRNKTTVALTLGAFIVQSSLKGGAMNAVQACIEQKKLMFTLDHEGDEYSGNRKIIALGGYSVSSQNAISTIERICSRGR